MVTVMTDKALRRAYLGAYEKYEDELKRQRITQAATADTLTRAAELGMSTKRLLTLDIPLVILFSLHGGIPMPNIKTAISIEKPIFDQVNDLAKNMKISRSRLFAIAAQEFIQRHANMELLQAINDAYDELPEVDTKVVDKMRPRHLKMVKNQW
jgi:hypothetical protein